MVIHVAIILIWIAEQECARAVVHRLKAVLDLMIVENDVVHVRHGTVHRYSTEPPDGALADRTEDQVSSVPRYLFVEIFKRHRTFLDPFFEKRHPLFLMRHAPIVRGRKTVL